MLSLALLLYLLYSTAFSDNLNTSTHPASFDIDRAIHLTNSLLNLIHHRYELNTTNGANLFHTLMNMDKDTWNIYKYKYAVRMLNDSNKDFLMIFGGSSVTAGHDNYFSQSYPMIIEKRLAPIMEAIGIKLIVHNIAQGANDCLPFNLCLESMGGHDPDWLGWEQGFNCGHSNDVFELVGRVAQLSANKALVFYMSSGGWKNKDCPSSPYDVPYCSEEWTPSDAGITEEWKPTAEDIVNEMHKSHEFYSAGASIARYLKWYNHTQDKGAGPHGLDSWTSNVHCLFDHEGRSKGNCDGATIGSSCALRFFSAEVGVYGQPGGSGTSHHPTRAMHMMRAEVVVWHMGFALLDALYMVKTDLTRVTRSAALAGYTDFAPHYSADTMESILVGSIEWPRVGGGLGITPYPEGYSDGRLALGLLDSKPMFISHRDAHSQLSLIVTIGEVTVVKLYGKGLSDTTISLEENINISVVRGSNKYIPAASSLVKWNEHTVFHKEHAVLEHLPRGTHLLLIESAQGSSSSLSHVVFWE